MNCDSCKYYHEVDAEEGMLGNRCWCDLEDRLDDTMFYYHFLGNNEGCPYFEERKR